MHTSSCTATKRHLAEQADFDHKTAATWTSFECSSSEPIPSGLLQWLHVAFTPAARLLLVEPEKNSGLENVIFAHLGFFSRRSVEIEILDYSRTMDLCNRESFFQRINAFSSVKEAFGCDRCP